MQKTYLMIYLRMVIIYNTFNIFKQEMSYEYIHMYTDLPKLRKRVVISTSLQLFRKIVIKICLLKRMLKVRTLTWLKLKYDYALRYDYVDYVVLIRLRTSRDQVSKALLDTG